MITQGGDPSLAKLYREACAEAGREPGLFVNPPPGAVLSAFVAEDVDRALAELGPYLLHDARCYARWLAGSGSVSATLSRADSVSALRAEGGSYRIFTPEEAAEQIRSSGLLALQPLCGGLPPKLAWRSLELLAERVLPELPRR